MPEELPQGIKKEEIEKLETQALKIIKENPDMFHKYLKDIESKNKAVANIISDRIERGQQENHRDTLKVIQENHKETVQVIERIAELIAAEGEKTRYLIAKG